MNKKLHFFAILAASFLGTQVYASNPASTDYVDEMILLLQRAGNVALGQLQAQLNLRSVPAGGLPGQVLTKTGTANYATAWVGTTYTVGQVALGGIVYWVDATGMHGLVADTADLAGDGSGLLAWSLSDFWSGTRADGVGIGAANTKALVAKSGVPAALGCSTDTSGSQNDWYLPSLTELSLLYQQLNVVDGFNGTPYWTSTEIDSSNANTISFADGSVVSSDKSTAYHVRCVRAF